MHIFASIREMLVEHDRGKAFLEEKLKKVEEEWKAAKEKLKGAKRSLKLPPRKLKMPKFGWSSTLRRPMRR